MPKKIIRRRRRRCLCGSGVSPSGGSIRRSGNGKKRGGSMRHHQITRLNKILTTAAAKKPTASNRANVTAKVKKWVKGAHSFASKYGLYSKGKNLMGAYLRSRNTGTNNRIGNTAPTSIRYHPSMDVN